jgi:hypothetical protein
VGAAGSILPLLCSPAIFIKHVLVASARHVQELSTELLAGPAAGLDRVAVRAQATIWAGSSGPPSARSQTWSISRIGSPARVRSWMSPVQRGFSHRPPLRTRTARRAAHERTGMFAVRSTLAPARSSAPRLAIAYSSR